MPSARSNNGSIEAAKVIRSTLSSFFARAWNFAWSDPLGYAQLQLYKLYLFWHGDEIGRNQDIYFWRNYSTVLFLTLWKAGVAFPFGALAPLVGGRGGGRPDMAQAGGADIGGVQTAIDTFYANGEDALKA